MKLKSRKTGRILSALLAAAMIITAMPQSLMTVQAAGETASPGVSATLTDESAASDASSGSDAIPSDGEGTPDGEEPAPSAPAAGEDTPTTPADDTDTSDDGTAPAEPADGNSTAPADDDTVSVNPVDDDTVSVNPADDNTAPAETTEAPDDAEPGTPADRETMAANSTIAFNFQRKEFTPIKKQFPVGSPIEMTEDLYKELFPELDGYCLTEWCRTNQLTDPWDFELDPVPSGSLMLYAHWEVAYNVTFDLQGKGETIIWPNMPAGYLIGEPKDLPVVEGFRLDGWYRNSECTEEEKWNFDTDKITDHITLYAKWTPLGTNTVTYNLQGHGENIVQQYLPDGPLDPEKAPKPEDKGYRFLGWYKSAACADGENWDFETDKIEGDITLYAKWEEILHTVTFDLQGHGAPIEALRLREESLITKSETLQPAAEGCHFEGWYKDAAFETPWDFATDTVTEDITLYAKWHELAADELVITFNLSGRGADFYRYLTAGSKIDAADIALPDDPEYRLTGWYKNADCAEADLWNFDTDTVTADMTLYAKWEEITYTVTFDLQGKGTNIIKAGLKPGALIPQTDDLKAEALQAGVKALFLGWYKDAACTEAWIFETDMVQQDITLYAKWQPCYTVTFDLQGHGANIVKTGIPEGSLIEQTPDLHPTAEGYHFENWYKKYNAETGEYSDIWDFDTDTVTADTTIYAKWKQLGAGEFVVTFDLNGHGADFFQYVQEGDKIEKPADPEDDGYLFLSWCTDESLKMRWNFDKDTVSGHMTLYAKWKDVSSLHVTAIEPVPYTGKAIKPAVSVYAYENSSPDGDGETTSVLLKNGKDYTVKYFNNTNTSALQLAQGIESGSCQAEDASEGGNNTTGERGVGGFNPSLPYMLIEGKGIYEGKIYMNFVISQIAIGTEDNNAAAGITFKCNDQLPIGTPKKDQALIASLKYKSALKENKDYTATVTVNGTDTAGSKLSKDASIWADGGDCTLTVKGIGNYTGIIVRQIIVRKKNTMLGNASLSLGAKCKSKSISTAGDDGVTLTPAWSEVVEEEIYDKYGDPVEDKSGNIKTKKVTYYYQYIDGEWKTDQDMWEYDSDDEGNEIVKKHNLDRASAFTVKLNGEWLKYGDDFTISYANNTAVGTATMTITGIGEYCGSKSVNFKIKGASGKAFNASTVVFAKDEDGGSGWVSKFTYDGTEKTQSVTLESKKRTKIYDCGYENGDEEEYEDKQGNSKTRKHKHNKSCDSHVEIDHTFGSDEYTVTYINNVKVGTATAIFTALPESGYTGSFKKTFKIVGVNMAEFVTFEGEGETLEPVIEETEKEVYVGKDEDGEPIYDTKYTRKVIATRKMEGTRPYVSTGAKLNFTLAAEGSESPLVLNKDYTISYKNNKSITPWKTRKWREKWQEEDENGKLQWEYGPWEYEDYPVEGKMGTLVLTGKGNYTGKLTIKYVIVAGELDTESAVVEVARSEYNPNTKGYTPKVRVWTPNAGYLAAKEFSVKYDKNKKDDVIAYMNGSGEAPTVTVTFKRNNSYTNLSDTKDEDGKVESKYDDDPIVLAPVPMEFYPNKLTAKNLYIIIDNDDPRELVYTGGQVTNVEARVYYGAPAAVKAAQAARETNHRLLTLSTEHGGAYGLQLLTEANEEQNGDYIVTYGKNNAIGKNKGSFTITGTGTYGGSVTQKFTIYRKPVSYAVTPIASE